jgi:hypothetical protein
MFVQLLARNIAQRLHAFTHQLPWFGIDAQGSPEERLASLQQLDGVTVGRLDEGHVSIGSGRRIATPASRSPAQVA